jgi:VWFA-related protein
MPGRAAPLAGWLVTALTAVAAAQQPVFRTRVEGVRVDVMVTRGGRPLAGLTAADFELRDSGVVQEVQAVSLEDIPLNLLLALDTSASVRGGPLELLKEAARSAVGALGDGDRAGLLTFSQALAAQTPWTADMNELAEAIRRMEASGSTGVHDAAFAALAQREKIDGRMLIILCSDSFDTASWLSPRDVIEAARRSDVVFYTVKVDSSATAATAAVPRGRWPSVTPRDLRNLFFDDPMLGRQEFLGVLAEETGGEVILAEDARRLKAVFSEIVTGFKTRYVLTYVPRGVPATGWHPIEVRLRRGPGLVRARRGYRR